MPMRHGGSGAMSSSGLPRGTLGRTSTGLPLASIPCTAKTFFAKSIPTVWQPIEGDVSELHVDFGPGYRMYFTRRGRVIVVMLYAGNKSSQKRDIRRALMLASELGDEL